MKKLGLLAAGGVAAVVLIANLGPMVGLVISFIIMYYSLKQFIKAEATVKKVLWAVIGFIALSASASNVPAILGVIAAYVLYMVYKKWNENKELRKTEDDPFTNFERQWAELKRNY
jgi:lia operon protein LiaI